MRTSLSLYSLDRPALQAFSKDLKSLLLDDDRNGLVQLLEVGHSLAERLASGTRAVDWFLRSESDPEALPLFASLRRIAKKRALSLAWTSATPSLEGRLRHYDVLRDDPPLARLLDKLLDPRRLPWFLIRPSATAGWLDDKGRTELASQLRELRPALPPELVAFAEAIHELDGDVVVHDML